MPKLEHEKYLLSVGEADLKRMTMLGEIYMPDCQKFLLENGLKPGLTIADVGSGPGNVSVWLAQQVGESGSVIAIDNSDEQLAILNKRIEKNNMTNIKTYKFDIYDIDQLEERFDMIFCRFLFVHLNQPLLIIKKLKKLLKSKGRLIICEFDNSTWFSYPEHDALQQDIKLLCKIGEKRGVDFCIGPKLFGLFQQAEFQSINFQIAQPVLSNEHREYLVLKSKAWAKIYLEYNLTSEADLQKLATNLQALVNNQDYLLMGAKMYLVCGRI